MIIKLKAGSTTAEIDTIGAQLMSFIAGGKEYVWQRDPAHWGKCSPTLFPIVSNVRNNKTNILGKEYTLTKHGFAREPEFEVVSSSDTEAVFLLKESADTLAKYPYKFNLFIGYVLTETSIEVKYTVKNTNDIEMDYCIGAHPAINLPLSEGDFDDYVITFNKEEGDTIWCDLSKDHFDVSKRINYVDASKKVWNVKYDHFDDDVIVFDKINSNSLTLINSKTKYGVRFDFNNFDSIAFWTPAKKQSQFLCLEPWNGMGVRSDENDEYAEKFSIQHLKVGEEKCCTWSIIVN